MSARNASSFVPYGKFQATIADLELFHQYSTLSLNTTSFLTHWLHESQPQSVPAEAVARRSAPTKAGCVSHGPADTEVKNVEVSVEWLPFDEYSRRSGMDLNEVQAQARGGHIGPVVEDPKTNEPHLIWPPKHMACPLEDLPPPGMKSFRVTMVRKMLVAEAVELDSERPLESLSKHLLPLASEFGDPDEVLELAQNILNRACFVQMWASFEVFLKLTTHELFRLHPEVLAEFKSSKERALTYAEILDLSSGFGSMDALRTGIVERELARAQGEQSSVHGIINLLKSRFSFDDDPYSPWFVLRGDRHVASYSMLMELKDVRNSLAHDAGVVGSDFQKRYPDVAVAKQVIVINDDYRMKAKLVLQGIAHSLAKSIVQSRYRVSN